MRASNRASRKIKGRLNPIDFFCVGNKNDDDVISEAYNESCIQAVGTSNEISQSEIVEITFRT